MQEILNLTSNFQTDRVIGEGSFGVVYRATLPDGTEVAIKRANTEALRSLKVFRTEVQLLSRLHHQASPYEFERDRDCAGRLLLRALSRYFMFSESIVWQILAIVLAVLSL